VDDVTDASFEREVLAAPELVVVDFWAPWCGPCRGVTDALRQLEQDRVRARFVQVNVDENPAAAAQYGVLSLPTVILFADGEPRETVVGARPRAYFERAFEPWLGVRAS
jgi:thioredoxin 1